MHPVRVRNFKQTLLQEGRCTVSNHTIALHLSETQTTVTRTTFDGLSGEDLKRSTCTSVDLVVDHMPQTLVVSWTQENLCSELSAGMTVVHNLKTTLLEIGSLKEIRDLIDSNATERSGIALLRVDSANL